MATDKVSQKWMSCTTLTLKGLSNKAARNWFIIAVVLAIFAAKAAPWIGRKGGLLKPSVTVKLAVAAIFLIIGLSLKTKTLRDTFFQWHIHATVQLFSLLLTPLVMCTFANALEAIAEAVLSEGSDVLNAIVSLLEGVKVLSCMPSPVSSAVILTKAVGGNEAAAVFNSTLGSFLGVVITPLMLLNITGANAEVPILSMFRGLGLQIIMPIFIGQGIRTVAFTDLDKHLKRFSVSKISSAILVLIIYTVFCDTFSGSFEIQMELLLALVLFLFLSMVFLIGLVYCVASAVFPYLTRSDMVAIMFCSTHKSLTLGMPLLKILFGDSSEISIAVISIPLLIYHPLQILLGSCLVAPLQRWMNSESSSTSNGSKSSLSRASLSL
ncbi:hypothetical protein AAMO2058_000378200 [Amorphochlora amoebiformis]|mmetsp:Transcript_8295/g.12969  ORF Transcript_8295/g.12969 Transcript_8295/m.12969 type:complete len:381 (-) Transcript_8295:78-1220(-)